jgi:alpha-tubulin suppressor-like RCC1 family protein
MQAFERGGWLMAFLGALAACGETPVEPKLSGVLVIQPPTATLDIGFTQQFSGVLLDTTGVPVSMPDSVHWLSLDTALVTVSWSAGVATGRGPGVARVEARLQHLRDTVEVTVRPLTLAALAPGHGITCATTVSQLGYCWGENDGGQLGDGTMEWHPIPGLVTGGLAFSSISANTDHACGLTPAGAAYCWGWNVGGRLGDGISAQEHRLVPTPVVGGLTFASVHTGAWFSCGLTTNGDAWCWGLNHRGSLGNDTIASSAGGAASVCDTAGNPYCAAPVPVMGGLTFTSLTTGGLTACGITAAQDAFCWGANISGSLGDGTVSDRFEPVAVAGDIKWLTISTGVGHTCGVAFGGTGYCWGSNWLGALGDGTGEGSFVPVPVTGGLTFETIGAGTLHTCGLTIEGAAYCWGDNLAGTLGQPFAFGGLESSPVPVPVSGGHTFTSLEVGANHACGRSTDGLFYCWGANVFGQLGIGTYTAGSYEPVPIFGQR